MPSYCGFTWGSPVNRSQPNNTHTQESPFPGIPPVIRSYCETWQTHLEPLPDLIVITIPSAINAATIVFALLERVAWDYLVEVGMIGGTLRLLLNGTVETYISQCKKSHT